MAALKAPSGTVTFLFTDIQGSTSLLQSLGRERYGTLLARHNDHLRAIFEQNGGIEVDRQGDGVFAVFRSAGAAVAAAAEAQRLFAREEWPQNVAVRVRMGLHTGEAAITALPRLPAAAHERRLRARRLARERRALRRLPPARAVGRPLAADRLAVIAYPSKRFRSAWIGIAVHSIQTVAIAVMFLTLVV
jgi:Adenylate and Guanylate cyclase catalytic domain